MIQTGTILTEFLFIKYLYYHYIYTREPPPGDTLVNITNEYSKYQNGSISKKECLSFIDMTPWIEPGCVPYMFRLKYQAFKKGTFCYILTGLSTKKPSLHESIGLLNYISNVDAEMKGNTPITTHDYHMCLNACIDFVPRSSSTVSPKIKVLLSPASP